MQKKVVQSDTIEWFFDLVFVALFIQLNSFLISNYSQTTFYIYSIILLWLYWVWVWYTIYHERLSHMFDEFEKKTIFFKVIILWLIWLSIPWILYESNVIFIICFALVRFLLLILRYRIYKLQKPYKKLAKTYILWFSFWVFIWLLSLLFDNIIYQMWLWSLAIAIDIFTSLIAEKKNKKPEEIYTHHYFERFSLLTFIALWELIITVVKNGYNIDLNNIWNISWVIILFLIIYWIYEKYFDEFYEAKKNYDIKKIHAYNYLHFLIIYAILLVWIWFNLTIVNNNFDIFSYNTLLIALWLIIFVTIIRILENFLDYNKLSLRRSIVLWFIIFLILIAYYLKINYIWAILIFFILAFEILLKTKNTNLE